MNKQQRKQIEAINAALCDLRSQIETLQSDEQDKYDNMPEHQGGDKGSSRGFAARSTAADAITEVIDALERAAE